MRSLYVTDRRSAGVERWTAILSALAGAQDLFVQVREKESTDRECLAWARFARERLGAKVPLYVNRRFDLALAARADGVHLPAEGLPLRRVKANTPRGFRVGISTHSAAQAIEAIEEGADLVVIGPIFDTPSKRAYGPPLGVEALAQLPLQAEHGAEVFAIGGIEERNLHRFDPYRDRISGIAGIRLFQDSEEPRVVAERISQR